MTKTLDTSNINTADLVKAITDLVVNRPTRRTKKGKGRSKPTPEQSAAHKAANDAECLKVFTEAGYKDVRPRENVKVYGRVKPDGTVTGWLGAGRKVKAGEKSLRVGRFALFHIDQTEVIAPTQAESATKH